MRILVVTHNRGLVGGLETYLHSLMPALHRNGHQLALLYHADASAAPRIDEQVDCAAVWKVEESSSAASVVSRLAAWNPDVIYLHDLPSLELHATLLAHYPVVMFAHSYNGTCPTGQKMHAFPVPTPCARSCGPACLALHYPRRCGGLNPASTIRNYRQARARQLLLNRHASILVAGEHMHREYLQAGVNADRVQVAPLPVSGLRPDVEPPSGESGRGELLFIGRLLKVKGVHYLLRAMPAAGQRLGRTLALTVAGSGPEESSLRQLARALGAEVTFAGWLGVEERISKMRSADLLVLPSLWPEPFGLVGPEAGCVGLPAVAYASGGISDWLKAGESGEAAPAAPPTVAGLADAIARALGDPVHHLRLRRGAWEMARRFSLESHLERLLPILESAARSGSGSHAEVFTSTGHNL